MPIGHEIIIFTFIWLRTLSTFSLSPCRGPGWTLQLLAMLHTPCSYHTLSQWHLFIHFIAFFPVYPVVVFRPACCKSSNLVIFFESTLKINLIFHPAHCQCSTLPFHHHLCACPPSPSTHNHANRKVITVRSPLSACRHSQFITQLGLFSPHLIPYHKHYGGCSTSSLNSLQNNNQANLKS